MSPRSAPHPRGPQLSLPLAVPPKRGGRRPGAGRPRKDGKPSRPGVVHLRRPHLDARHPVHVTLRGLREAPSFRSDLVSRIAIALFEELEAPHRAPEPPEPPPPTHPRFDAEPPFGTAPRPRRARRPRRTDRVAAGFHVVHYSLQRDHVHLLVEAPSARALSAGMRRLVIRLAKRINALVRHTAKGRIWADRYHRRDLGSPRAVRNALVYVLQNGRKHAVTSMRYVDALSSSTVDDHMTPRAVVPLPIGPPRTWLLGVGWRRAGGPLRIEESPVAPA